MIREVISRVIVSFIVVTGGGIFSAVAVFHQEFGQGKERAVPVD